ncbi:unnamed protein product, partial [marine sediment metagenome]
CFLDGSCASTANPLSDDVLFYFHDEGGDWGYELMTDTGSHGVAETSDSCAATNGYCSLGGYITATSTINTVTWPEGTYHFHIYADVHLAVGTSNKVVADVFSVDTSGTETWQFQATSSELTIDDAQLYHFTSSQAEITTGSADDKMLVKLQGWTDSMSAKTITYYYEGTAHYSHFHTTFSNAIELGNYTQTNVAETITSPWIINYASSTAITISGDIWLSDLAVAAGTVLAVDGDGLIIATSTGAGTVTSVDMSVPTGFAISGNPVTTSGTLALAFDTGYTLPTDAEQLAWDNKWD